MFGLGMGEILVILVVALLFLGPEKLPEAAKTISKGIRDFRKQTRELQQTIEEDTEFGGAIRDLKSALRGDDLQRYLRTPADRAHVDPKAAVQSGAAAGALAGADAPPVPAEDEGTADGADAPADDDVPLVRPAASAVAKGQPLDEPDGSGDTPPSGASTAASVDDPARSTGKAHG